MSQNVAGERNVTANDNASDLLRKFEANWQSTQPQELSLTEYLTLCKTDKSAYATAHERLLTAIGEPVQIETSKDAKLSRIYSGQTITRYPAFAEFYGMEDTIESVVSFLKQAAQGFEERKQILYLLGPVGGGKSSIAERLKDLMQNQPFYALAYKGEISPVHENPLGLLNTTIGAKDLEAHYGIDSRYLRSIMSPWAVKRLNEDNGSLKNFTIMKVYPSIAKQVAISKTEPGDDSNQDISALVGKVDISMLDQLPQNDTDAYNYSGGLCKGNRGIMEFVEMFKAPIKALHPLLTATQEANYNGTENIGGGIPFDGIVLAHSNESEWKNFRNNPNNEAFIDRVCVVKVPYALRVTEEVKIYKKLIAGTTLNTAPVAPRTLETLAQFAILTRLKEVTNSDLYSKLRVYDGENLKETQPNAKSLTEYKDAAGVDEGMSGLSTRAAYKVLSATFNRFARARGEIAADPIQLMQVLHTEIDQWQLPEETAAKYHGFIEGMLKPEYKYFIEEEIKTAYIESYASYGQNIFDRYVAQADRWIDGEDYRDADTGVVLNKTALNEALEKIERPSGISNPKDFRNEVVRFALRAREKNNGKNPDWTSYEKMKQVIKKIIFTNTEEMLPIISFGQQGSEENQKKHADFVKGMIKRGYTDKQVRRAVDWYRTN